MPDRGEERLLAAILRPLVFPLVDVDVVGPLRVDWPTYTAALKAATGKEFKELLPFEGKIPAEQNYLRRLLQLAV